jgi:hypothetical protein
VNLKLISSETMSQIIPLSKMKLLKSNEVLPIELPVLLRAETSFFYDKKLPDSVSLSFPAWRSYPTNIRSASCEIYFDNQLWSYNILGSPYGSTSADIHYTTVVSKALMSIFLGIPKKRGLMKYDTSISTKFFSRLAFNYCGLKDTSINGVIHDLQELIKISTMSSRSSFYIDDLNAFFLEALPVIIFSLLGDAYQKSELSGLLLTLFSEGKNSFSHAYKNSFNIGIENNENPKLAQKFQRTYLNIAEGRLVKNLARGADVLIGGLVRHLSS